MPVRANYRLNSQTAKDDALIFPPPLWGRVLEGGEPQGRCSWLPPSPALPLKGGESAPSASRIVVSISNSQGNRHCEPTGRAEARPMTGSAKQSIGQQEWIASSLSLLAMTLRHKLAFSPRDAPEVCQKFPSTLMQRAQGMPGARCTRSL